MACFTVYLALISVVALPITLNATPIPWDAESLLALKQSFVAFPLHDWRDGDLSNFCNWTGVTRDNSNQSVIALNLQNKAIFGSLPLNFPTFTHLTTLNLSSNSIAGPIPSFAFASCSALAFLSLDHNNLTGTLPLSLANCTALKILNLSVNELTGPVSSSLSKLSNLQQLNLCENNFTSPMTQSLSNCTHLRKDSSRDRQLLGVGASATTEQSAKRGHTSTAGSLTLPSRNTFGAPSIE
ncbi:LRR receptor-like serine/threonine-protein kinase ERL1 [Cryptomeria japonica]|uniref:LRR receptor-like serine/threonine-protein kinase ERL1 n=1 Tax=Cryptomeria japonica TaxID=3369 RepID=UPI0027DA61AD|nr:LRR receptor-like serine/threonine-protein kinase ERL1 [Cryptomeria japonica]